MYFIKFVGHLTVLMFINDSLDSDNLFNIINTLRHFSVQSSQTDLILSMLLLFLLSLVTGDQGDLTKIVHSIADITERCDQSRNNLEILNAVHTSLDLQVIKLTNYIDHSLPSEESDWAGGADLQPGVPVVRPAAWQGEAGHLRPGGGDWRPLQCCEERGESWPPVSLLHEVLQVLQCRGCPVTYTKANTNRGNGMNLNSGVFTSPVNGSFYFQVGPTQERLQLTHLFSSTGWWGRETRPGCWWSSTMRWWPPCTTGTTPATTTDTPCSDSRSSWTWRWYWSWFSWFVSTDTVKTGDRFSVVLDKGSLGVSGGRNHFISFLGHRLSQQAPWDRQFQLDKK